MILNKLKAIFSKPNPELAKTIEQLDMTARTYNILSRAGIYSVGDLAEMSWTDISALRGSVRRTCMEVEGLLKGMGLGLRKE